MNYQIIVYCWEIEEETPTAIIDLKVIDIWRSAPTAAKILELLNCGKTI